MLNERSQLNVLSVRLSVSWVFSLFFFSPTMTAVLSAVGPHLGSLLSCRNFHDCNHLLYSAGKKGISSRRLAFGRS